MYTHIKTGHWVRLYVENGLSYALWMSRAQI